ncbi:MAG: protoporphyrinogen/coproporphyrinogen oxidase [Desulfuromonadales bacterium]|nr:protoporphyrinogen/coproporphyrinogen oxidase [Desulfuromonadales bacterium]
MNVTVVGAGISGLATAFVIQQRARRLGLNINLRIFEKDTCPGGKIRSEWSDGYLCEWGPNGFLDSKPTTLGLCCEAGLEERLLPSNDAARKRFIFSHGRLQRVPETAGDFFRSSLVSWPGKLRLAGEILVPRRKDDADETLADFVRRRLGQEALDQMVGPMAAGIFAGDPETMSLRSCFPRIHELEQQYGGLIRALLLLARKKRAERRAGKAVAGAAGPGGVLTSFAGGIQELTDGLARHLAPNLHLAEAIAAITPLKEGFSLQTGQGRVYETEVLVAAVPAMALAAQIEGFSSSMAAHLRQIPYAPLQVACFGYRKDAVPLSLDGFGYLAARRSGLHSLGTLWSSSIFPGRAPEGHVLLRTMFGGATRPDAADLSADEVRARIQEDLLRTMSIKQMPDFVKIIRHSTAIPQYVSGHSARLKVLEGKLSAYPGLILAGNAFYGVGLNDCVASAGRAADRVLTLLQQRYRH